MNGYAVVSSVHLHGPVYTKFGQRLTWLSRPSPIHGPASIVYLGGCQSSFGREQLSSRGSIFRGDNFALFMGDTFSRGGIVPHFWIRYIEKGPHYMEGIGYFVTPAHLLVMVKM